MGREARRARGREGKTREGWGGVRVKFVRVKFVRGGGWATSRGCGYRWMNGWMDDDVVDVARSVAARRRDGSRLARGMEGYRDRGMGA